MDSFQPIPSKKILALIDCNNFFASCERVSDPDLIGKPVVVLSNVGGIAIARSNEAKALGIKMGQPYFQWQHLVKKNNVQIKTANFPLYSDLSGKVMESLYQFSPDIEVYSIDEAFLGLETIAGIKDLVEYGQKIKEGVLKDTCLPVSVGIAPTKTLAKLASHVAKNELNGVCSLMSSEKAEKVMKETPVGEIWGVGRQTTKWLTSQGILTALDLKNSDDKVIKKNMGVVGLRTVWELRGISCLALEDIPSPQQSISVTRTFGAETKELDDLKQAVSGYVAQAAENMRSQKQVAGCINVFITTGPFKPNYYGNSASAKIDPRTNYTPELTSLAVKLLGKIFRAGLAYKRAGITLSDLVSQNEVPRELFQDEDKHKKSEKLMSVIDKLNEKFCNEAVFFAGEKRGKVIKEKRG
jgi:DNA polymerase V